MTRYLRLLRLFWSTSLAAEMEYRSNFAMSLLSSAGGLAGSIFGVSLFYRSGTSLGGWSWEEALLVLGLFTMLTCISRCLFSPNLSRIVEHVRTGTLDFVLLKPVDSQFWLSTRRFSPWGVTDGVFGLCLLAYAASKLKLSVAACLVSLLPVACSVTILYSLWFLLASTTIWYVKIYNVTEVLQAWLDAGRFPIYAFPPGLYRFVFTFIVPVAFLTTIPAEAVLGRAELPSLSMAAAIALTLFTASRIFWRFALRYYTSASS
jgi:ABC-2 type transport system permease protein